MRDDAMAGNVTSPPDDPAAIPLEYVPIPAGPDGSILIAHDRHRLSQVAARALVPARTLRVGSLPHDASVVAQIESKAVRRQRGLRRSARARQVGQLIAAAGLPFLVAALLGLLALPIRGVPVGGDAVARFIETAGGSVGGPAPGRGHLAVAVRLADPARAPRGDHASRGTWRRDHPRGCRIAGAGRRRAVPGCRRVASGGFQ